MKTQTAIVLATAFLATFLGSTRSAEIESYSVIDPIIKAILEKMRPQLADLTIDDINQVITSPNLNATIIVKNIQLNNADKFVIQNLKSTLIPLKLTNLTLTWADINARATYDISATLALSETGAPITIVAQGDAKANLENLFLTAGANVELKNKEVQIKPRGIFGFDVYIGSARVTLSSLLGSPELGRLVGEFIGNVIPELVNVLKQPAFNAFQDDIINFLNEVLRKGESSLVMDEYPELQESEESEEFESADFSEIRDRFLRGDWGFGRFDDNEIDFNNFL